MSTENSITDKQIDDLIEILLGTCKSMDEACLQLEICWEDISTAEKEKIDFEIFRCEECSWWSETEHQGTREQCCQDCAPEEDQENDS